MSFTNKIDEWMKEAEERPESAKNKTGTSFQTCLFILIEEIIPPSFLQVSPSTIN